MKLQIKPQKMLWKFSHWIKPLFFLLLTPNNSIANVSFRDIDNTQFSVLTCDPGNEIYSLFGHSGLRIKNTSENIDQVINWGLFEFSDDQLQFGYDFAKGRLSYYMGFQRTASFLYEYQSTNRKVSEQILNLSKENKTKLIELININNLPENRKYKYEFFYDNCSSKIRDLLNEVFGSNLVWGQNKDANQFTFREIINENLQYKPWLGLGINLVLGSPIDVKVDNNNLMFLPKYVEEILDKTIVNERDKKEKIVIQKINLISGAESFIEITNISFWFWLSFMFTILLLILKLDLIFKFWSSISLFGLGLLGVVLLFMWFGTDHQGTKNNFNLLWATPTHWLMLIFILSKNPSLFKSFFAIISLVIIFSTILFWFVIPQEFHQAIKPLILQISIIYFYYYKKNKQQLNLTKTSDSV
jgi:hypothetical protein